MEFSNHRGSREQNSSRYQGPTVIPSRKGGGVEKGVAYVPWYGISSSWLRFQREGFEVSILAAIPSGHMGLIMGKEDEYYSALLNRSGEVKQKELCILSPV